MDTPQYKTVQLDLGQGDILVLCTDGIIEATDAQDRQFGVQRMRDVLLAKADRSAQEILDAWTTALDDHRGNEEMQDDLTCLLCDGPAEWHRRPLRPS